MKYELNTKIGEFTITNWVPSLGNYELQCNCGNVTMGPSHYVSSRMELLENLGFVDCKYTQNYGDFLKQVEKIYNHNVQRLSETSEYSQVRGKGE